MKARLPQVLFALCAVILFCGLPVANAARQEYDIIVYGATSAGVTAAIQASRMGKSVALIEPTRRIGGLTTGGLGQTDIGNKQAIGGISREFYQNIRRYYEDDFHWKWQTRSEYQDGGQTRTHEGEDAMWTFEPSAALQVFLAMLTQENVGLALLPAVGPGLFCGRFAVPVQGGLGIAFHKLGQLLRGLTEGLSVENRERDEKEDPEVER